MKCPNCGEILQLETTLATLRSELKEIFESMLMSDHYRDGFDAGLQGIKEAACRHEIASDEWGAFHDGHEVGLRVKAFLEGGSGSTCTMTEAGKR